jgi:hypothetical protein
MRRLQKEWPGMESAQHAISGDNTNSTNSHRHEVAMSS